MNEQARAIIATGARVAADRARDLADRREWPQWFAMAEVDSVRTGGPVSSWHMWVTAREVVGSFRIDSDNWSETVHAAAERERTTPGVTGQARPLVGRTVLVQFIDQMPYAMQLMGKG